jgi:hypothetical protein
MFIKRRLAAVALVVAASALGSPAALAHATTTRATDPVITGPSCPSDYSGPTNLATGCPYSTMSYTVQYAGQAPYHCPAYPPARPASPGVDAAAGSVPGAVDPCRAVPRAN